MYYLDEAPEFHLSHLDATTGGIQRPAPNNDMPNGALPITEADARAAFADAGMDYDADIARPMTSEAMREYLDKQILPAIRHLQFMGIDPLPEIKVIAPWSRTDNDGIEEIRYPAYVDPEVIDEDEVNEILDIALTNAYEGELPATLGHVSLAAFAVIVGTYFVAIDKSTTAHRRYKDAFPDYRFRLIFHVEYNHVELIMPDGLLDALDESVQCFMWGR